MAKRKELLSYTDTKSQALKRKKLLSKGYTGMTIKKEYGGYSVMGRKKTFKRKKRK